MSECDLCGKHVEDLYYVAGENGKSLFVCGDCSDACTGHGMKKVRKRC